MKLLSRITALASGLLCLCHAADARTARRHRAAVTVTRVDYRGWTNCVRISNGLVEAIVVPDVGRIMAFEFVGKPKSDVVFANQDLLGKTAATSGATGWANFGGDKLWPAPQSAWDGYITPAWPPDLAFDGAPEPVVLVPGGVRMETARSRAFGLQAVRTITMRPGEPRLYIRQTLSRFALPHPMRGAKGIAPDPAVAIWSITQVRPDADVYIPLGPKSRFANGVVNLLAEPGQKAGLPPSCAVRNGVLGVRRDPANSFKCGVDSHAGTIFATFADGYRFSEHYRYHPGRTYPDGCSAEVYSNGGDTAYLEMELLSPLAKIPVGGSITYPIYWQIDLTPRHA